MWRSFLARRPGGATLRPPLLQWLREVPPDVTTGRVVVVVGALVDVVVGGAVTGDDGVPVPPGPRVVDVVGGASVVVGAVGAPGGLDPADEPGCSFATTTPMHTVAPPASTTANLVSRLMRACADARARGEGWSGPRLTAFQGGTVPAPARARSFGPRLTTH